MPAPSTSSASSTRPAPERARPDHSAAERPSPARPAPTRPSWTRSFVEDASAPREMVIKSATGLGLAALYGLALGARHGGVDLLLHAAGVPAALVAVTLLGLPALYIVLSLFDAPLSPRQAMNSAASAIASAGLVLAGLAPLAALYVVTSGSEQAAMLAGGAGLMVGGALGMRHLLGALRRALAAADGPTKFMAFVAQGGFALFAIILATRVWAGLLPLFGGAQ